MVTEDQQRKRRAKARAKVNAWRSRNRELTRARQRDYNARWRARRKGTLPKKQRPAKQMPLLLSFRRPRVSRTKTKDNRNYFNLLRYRLTVAQYDEMWHRQNGRCAICNKTPAPGKVLAIDHCHTTGNVRGLLCYGCNTGLGCFADSIPNLQSATDYLSVGGKSEGEVALHNSCITLSKFPRQRGIRLEVNKV